MRILVIDQHLKGRSGGSETDMYMAMTQRHDLTFATPENLAWLLEDFIYDTLYLGPYHFRMDINWHQVFFMNTKPVFISQADNEEFAMEPPEYPQGSIILCKYLPNTAIAEYAAQNGYKTAVLPWYIHADKFPQNKKTCDVAFICSMKGARPFYATKIRQVCEENGWTCVIGEYHGKEYYELLSKCRVMIAECDRHCMTLKYIEGALSGCAIVGDGPRYPASSLRVHEAELWSCPSLTRAIKTALDWPTEFNHQLMMNTHANEAWFLDQFDKAINQNI